MLSKICTPFPHPVLTLALAPQLIPSRNLPDLDTARFQARAYARGKAASGRIAQQLTSGLVTPASSQEVFRFRPSKRLWL